MVKKEIKKTSATSEEGCECGSCHDSCCCSHSKRYGTGNAIYGLGFIGAAIYYISTASGFWMGVLGVLKAIVWPAFLVFEVMKYLGL